MNIFKFELRQLRFSILIWGLVVPTVLYMFLAFYPLINSSGADFDMIMNELPDEMLAIFGMHPDLPVSDILGYTAMIFTMVQIPLAIQASNYGFNMLSVEERELTADFLLSKPVTRSKIIISKFLASLTALVIVNIILFVTFTLGVMLFKADSDVDMSKVYVLLSTVIFFQLTFMSIGMFVSVLVKKVPSVLTYSMALGFGTFIITSLGQMISSDIFQFFSPYSYFAPQHILLEGSYDALAIIGFIITIISLVGSYFLYLRRNIPSL